VVIATNQLKLRASDGKMRLTDVLDAEGIGQEYAEQQGFAVY